MRVIIYDVTLFSDILSTNTIFSPTDTPIGYRNPENTDEMAGEIALFPPSTPQYSSTSVSFGMVAIKCSKEGNDWKLISVDDPYSLSKNVPDTLCRGLGYTNAVPNSARTLEYYTKQ